MKYTYGGAHVPRYFNNLCDSVSSLMTTVNPNLYVAVMVGNSMVLNSNQNRYASLAILDVQGAALEQQ